MELEKLIPLLRANGVRTFKGLNLEIEFESKQFDDIRKDSSPAPAGTPPEIVNPELMSADTIRNWSAPPGPNDGNEIPLPLTGEEPSEAG